MAIFKVLLIAFMISTLVLCNSKNEKVLKFLTENDDNKANSEMKQSEEITRLSDHSIILPGMGFSSDRKGLGSTQCYNPITTTKGNQSSTINFSMSEDLKKLSSVFNMNFSVGGSYWIFSGNAEANYIRELEENQYSLSFFYHFKISSTTSITFSYDPETIFNGTGKNLYKNGENPLFRVICGEKLINSYEEGAALIYSLTVNFQSKLDKETFSSKVGLGIGDFFNASTNISNITSQYSLVGNIKISAFQLGGDPSALGKVISSEITQCSLDNIESCKNAAKALINYSNTDFPSQFKRDEQGIWTGPLVPLGSYNFDISIEDLGMKLSPSYVTEDVKNARNDLDALYLEARLVDISVNNLLNYPAPFESQKKQILDSISNTIKNFKLVFINGDENYKAADCYSMPYKCLDVQKYLRLKYDNSLFKTLVDTVRDLEEYYQVDTDVNFSLGIYRGGATSCGIQFQKLMNPHYKKFPRNVQCSQNECGKYKFYYENDYDNVELCKVWRNMDCNANNIIHGVFQCESGSGYSNDTTWKIMKNPMISELIALSESK